MNIIPYNSRNYLKQKDTEVKKSSNNRNKTSYSIPVTQMSFTSLNRVRLRPTEGSYLSSFNNACVNYTSYFRSYEALKAVKNHLGKHFPEGAVILNYACSNGEEPETLAMQLSEINKDKKYHIIAYDIDPEVIDIAQKKCHCICEGFDDDFLLKKNTELSSQQIQLKKLFFEYFEKSSPPGIKLFRTPDNNTKEGENYFKVREGAFDGIIDYRGGDASGNIENINMANIEDNRPPAVVLFRNAFYHLTDNPSYKALITDFSVNKYNMEPVNAVIDKIYNILPENGLLVAGNSHYDHIYLAPENTPPEETIALAETSEGQKQIAYLKQRAKAFTSLLSDPQMCQLLEQNTQEKIEKIQQARIYKVSPLQKIIERDGRFKAIHWENVDNMPEITVPTIWQKVSF